MNQAASTQSALSLEDRIAITHGVMHLFDNWGLQAEEAMALLELEGKPRQFSRYRYDTPFPEDAKLMRRIEYLIRIDAALRTTYPTNPSMGKRWLRQTNRHFRQQTPLATMLDNGETGLVKVLCQLDCTFAWDLTGSKPS